MDSHQGFSGRDCNEERILVLQGGGALGAYQAGVYETLSAAQLFPHWVAGISIGAINAALICGNPPEQRLQKLREFWETITSSYALLPLLATGNNTIHSVLNEVSAMMGTLFGLPGFFSPRFPLAFFQVPDAADRLSLYDTRPLRLTLERLVDFDLLNSGKTRLSVGAVNIRSGNFVYFDTAEQRLDARHIMASGAVPLGFPPVEIDGEWFWDGGLVSNTPLQYVLDQPRTDAKLIFQVDLFSAEGPMPSNLTQVAERERDIRFSSRTRLNTAHALSRTALELAVRRLLAKLPPDFAVAPELKALATTCCESAITVVHLIYRRQRYESQSKSYEFSRLSMQEHWQAGREDMTYSLNHPGWCGRIPAREGVQVFDLTKHRERPSALTK